MKAADVNLVDFVLPVVWTHQMLDAVDNQRAFVVVHWDDDVAFPILKVLKQTVKFTVIEAFANLIH